MVEISLQPDEYSKSYARKQVSFFPHFFVVQQIGQVFLAFTLYLIMLLFLSRRDIRWRVNSNQT
jgi:hypothetical protein